jgi:hypothetical protein
MKLFQAMSKIMQAQHAQTGQLPDTAEYKRAAKHLARQDAAGDLVDKSAEQTAEEYLAWLAAQEWTE